MRDRSRRTGQDSGMAPGWRLVSVFTRRQVGGASSWRQVTLQFGH